MATYLKPFWVIHIGASIICHCADDAVGSAHKCKLVPENWQNAQRMNQSTGYLMLVVVQGGVVVPPLQSFRLMNRVRYAAVGEPHSCKTKR